MHESLFGPSRQAAFFGPTVANGAERTWLDPQLAPPRSRLTRCGHFDGVSFQCLAVDGLGKAMNSISCRSFVDTKDESVRILAVLLISLASAYSAAANAQISDNLVRIGVLGDLAGVYADIGGPATSLQPVWPSKTSAAKCLANRSML